MPSFRSILFTLTDYFSSKTKKMKEAGEQAWGSFFSFNFTFNLLPAAGELCEERLDPCLSQPCTAGSTCDAFPQGGFICMCPPGRKGNLCQDRKWIHCDFYCDCVPEWTSRYDFRMFWSAICMLGCTFVPPGLICIHSLASIQLSKGMWSVSEVETSM